MGFVFESINPCLGKKLTDLQKNWTNPLFFFSIYFY